MRAPRAAGFTLIELLVTMLVVAVVLGAALALFNSMNELSRVQIHQADMQQAVRVAQREITRLVQMTGRGGLAGGSLIGPASETPAIEVRNNVPPDSVVVAGGPEVVEGTDVLTVRGILNSSVLQVAFNDPAAFTFDGADAGTLVVGSRTPTGIPQSLEAFEEAVEDAVPEALVIVNAVNELTYAVVELDPNTTTVSCLDPEDVTEICSATIGFRTSGGHTADYAVLSPSGTPAGMIAALSSPGFRPGFVGILEEYRYYVREDTDADGEPIHKLSRARVFPGTETAYKDEPAIFLQEDLADYIFDLQVALGFDSSFSADGTSNGFFAFDNEVPPATGNDDLIYDNGDAADDWLFNAEDAAAEEATLANLPWSPAGIPPAWTPEQPQPILYYARVTTLGRAARRDRGFAAPLLERLEDHVYEPDDYLNTQNGRAHRREILQSVIDLRNLG